jgi:non-ribosomal peptide synthetase component F
MLPTASGTADPADENQTAGPARLPAVSDDAGLAAALAAFNRPFDLGQAPLFRLGLLALPDGTSVLFAAVHAIIADPASLDLLLTDLAKAYDDEGRSSDPNGNLVSGSPDPDNPLAGSDESGADSPAADGNLLPGAGGDGSAPWPSGSRASEGRPAGPAAATWADDRSYWLDRVADGGSRPGYPLDAPRPPRRPFVGATLRQAWPADNRQAVLRLAAACGVSEEAVLLAAFLGTAGQLSGRGDVTVGLVRSGRCQPAASLIAPLETAWPMRANLSRAADFTALAGRVATLAADAAEHASYTAADLAWDAMARLDLARCPFFDLVLAWSDQPLPAPPRFGALAPRRTARVTGLSGTDLRLTLAPAADGGYEVTADYASALFRPAAVGLLLGHLRRLLLAAAAAPATRLSELPPADPDDLARLRRCREPAPAETGAVQRFRAWAQTAPEQPAVVDDRGGGVTYSQLDLGARRLAAALRAVGVKPGDLVALLSGRSLDYYCGLLGILYAGAAYAPLDAGADPAATGRALAVLQPAAAVVDGWALAERTGTLPLVCLADPALGRLGAPDPEPSDLAAPAYVLFHDGPAPTATVVGQAALAARAGSLGSALGLGPADQVLAYAPLAAESAVREWAAAFFAGATLRTLPEQRRQDPVWLDAYLAQGVTVAALPLKLAQLTDGASLRLLVLDAAGPDALADPGPTWRNRCIRVYGTAETGPAAAWRLADGAAEADRSLPQPPTAPGAASTDTDAPATPARAAAAAGFPPTRAGLESDGPTENQTLAARLGPGPAASSENRSSPSGQEPLWPATALLGRPLPGCRIDVVDQAGRPVGRGWPGRITVSGPATASGLLCPPAGAGSFEADPEGGCVVRTPDMGRWDAAGQLVRLDGLEGKPAAVGESGGASRTAETGEASRAGETDEATRTDEPDKASRTDEADPALAAVLAGFNAILGPLPAGPTALASAGTANKPADTTSESADTGASRTAAGAGTGKPLGAEISRRPGAGVGAVVATADFFARGGHPGLALKLASWLSERGWPTTAYDILARRTPAAIAAGFPVPPGPTASHPLSPAQARCLARSPLAVPAGGDKAGTSGNRPAAGRTVFLALPGGRFDLDALRLAIDAVTACHDQLRARFDATGSHVAPAASAPALPLEVTVLPPRAVDLAAVEAVGAALLDSFDPARGPLAGVHLWRAADGDRLLVAAHRLAVDEASWGPLLGGLFAAYRQARAGQAPDLGLATSYAAWLAALRDWLDADQDEILSSWPDRAAAVRAADLPLARPGACGPWDSRARQSAFLGPDQTRRLLAEAPRAYTTTAADLVLAAVAWAAHEVFGLARVAVEVEGDGRVSPARPLVLDCAIGCFTTIYPVIVEASPLISADIIAAKEARLGTPAGGLAYDWLARPFGPADPIRPHLRFAYRAPFDPSGLGQSLALATWPAAQPDSPTDLSDTPVAVVARVGTAGLAVEVDYAVEAFDQATAYRFLSAIVHGLHSVVEHCGAQSGPLRTPADVGAPGLDGPTVAALNALAGEVSP